MNIILDVDSYKFGSHWNMYPEGLQHIYSYWESRVGAKYPTTLFYGLQPILRELEEPLHPDDVEEAKAYCDTHLGEGAFNEEGFNYILEKHKGLWPISICAVPEGSIIPESNVMMTIENTDPNVPWIGQYLETLLSRVWYTSTVATRSYHIKQMLRKFVENTCDDLTPLPFMLHDFGARSVSCTEQAGLGGSAHLINFLGTDTVPALKFIQTYYGHCDNLGYSVPATEHSIACMEGVEGEANVVKRLLDRYPSGILSLVADSYNIYRFVDTILPQFKEQILARDGKLVVRPDSVTKFHPEPADQVVWILKELHKTFGSTINSKQYRVLNKCAVLWGDGITEDQMERICAEAQINGFASSNLVFGCGSYLLQKLDRDTQRFAFKASAACLGGEWKDVYKEPLDNSKSSKKGKLILVKHMGGYETLTSNDPIYPVAKDELREVFRDGYMLKEYTFDQVRENAKEN